MKATALGFVVVFVLFFVVQACDAGGCALCRTIGDGEPEGVGERIAYASLFVAGMIIAVTALYLLGSGFQWLCL